MEKDGMEMDITKKVKLFLELKKEMEKLENIILMGHIVLLVNI